MNGPSQKKHKTQLCARAFCTQVRRAHLARFNLFGEAGGVDKGSH
jgi:hypothetical protein